MTKPPPRLPEETLREHERFVRAVSQRLLGDPHAVEDNVQDTWLAALERPPRHDGSVRGWLGVVARRLAFRARRTAARRAAREAHGARSVRLPSTAEVAARLEMQRQVLEGVQALSEPYRSTVVLRYLHGMPPREIAVAQDAPLETVRTRLYRALGQLRRHLDARHAGNRRRWRRALVPLVAPYGLPPAELGTALGPGVVLGGLVMKKKVVVLAALLVAAAALLLGREFLDGGVPSSERVDTTRPGAVAHAPDAHLRGLTQGPAQERRLDVSPTVPEAETFELREVLGRGTVVFRSSDPWGRGFSDRSRVPFRVTEEATADATMGALRVRTGAVEGLRVAEAVARVEERVGPRQERVHEERLAVPGMVTVQPLLPGEPTASVRHGDLERRLSVDIEAGLVTELEVDFAPGAEVSGQVRHVRRGSLPAVSLRFERWNGAWLERLETTTDAAGRYRFDDVPAGRWVVLLSGGATGDHFRPRGELTVSGTGPLTHDILVGAVALRGTVRHAMTRDPIPAATIRLAGFRGVRTSTDAHGIYAVADITPGTYPLHVTKSGFAVWEADAVRLEADSVRTLDIELHPSALLQLRVTDGADEPITGFIRMQVESPAGGVVATPYVVILLDGTGRGVCQALSPGVYDLTIEVPNCATKSVRVELRPDGSTLDVTVEREGDGGRVSLHGTVTDAATGAPIAGVRLRATIAHGLAFTDEAGHYVLRDLDGPLCGIEVVREGYGYRMLRDIELAADEARVLDIQLVAAATLYIFVEDATGEPVSGSIMTAVRPRDGQEGTRITTGLTADATGRIIFRWVVPGAYTFRFDKEDAGTATLEVEIRPGANTLYARLE